MYARMHARTHVRMHARMHVHLLLDVAITNQLKHTPQYVCSLKICISEINIVSVLA